MGAVAKLWWDSHVITLQSIVSGEKGPRRGASKKVAIIMMRDERRLTLPFTNQFAFHRTGSSLYQYNGRPIKLRQHGGIGPPT